MTESRIQILSEQDALDRIVDTVQRAEPGEAPFALVLGAGFSYGLVPTARQLVNESLPLWAKSRTTGDPFDALRNLPADQRIAIAREFWSEFVRRNTRCQASIVLDSHTGLPADHAAAYMAAFDPMCSGAAGAPAAARKFQRTLMRLDQPRLNAAHFLLASVLGVQPRKSRPSPLFMARAAFCRLILTTNFDPFLQTALQAVNRLYFMSDTPDLGLSDEILDDHTDAIHLVYLHGSIHRRLQATSSRPIEQIKEDNARTLASCLKRRGVIVLGYSGWDDVVVKALAMCEQFDHRLYWCGLEADPLAKNAFGPDVPEILRKPTAQYVRIDGAGRFMARLLTRLTGKLPRLLDNPIGQLRDLLEMIDLGELEKPRLAAADGSSIAQPSFGGSSEDAFVKAKASTLERLEQAKQAFDTQTAVPPEETLVLKESAPAQAEAQARVAPVAPLADSRTNVRQLLASAQLAGSMGNYLEAQRLCGEALAAPGLEPKDRAQVLIARGAAHYFSGRIDDAIADWTQVIRLPDAPIEQMANALYNRGVAWSQEDQADKALADYTYLIEQLPDAPAEQVAGALANRGWLRYERNDYCGFLADTEAALSKAPPSDIAAFSLGLALLACYRDLDALAAYRSAAEQFPEQIDILALPDLAEARRKWLSDERAEPVIQLLQSLRTPPRR